MNFDINSYLNSMDMRPIESALQGRDYHLSFGDMVRGAINGQLDLSPAGIAENAAKMFFSELYQNGALMRNLLIVAILSALLKTLTESFKHKGVGEVGFFVSYIIIISLLMASFGVSAGIMRGLIQDLSNILVAALPLLLSLLAMSGSIAGAAAFQPVTLFVIEIATAVIANVIIPVITLAAGIKIVNYLSERETFGKFADLIRKACEWGLKIIMIVFMAAFSLQRVSAPILNNVALKTARSVAGAVPLVGDMLTGAADAVSAFAGAAKSGVSIAVIIFIVLACAVPICKLLALIAVYKLTAAVFEPVCDERITDCIDAIGSFAGLMLAAGVTVVVMFIFAVLILLSF